MKPITESDMLQFVGLKSLEPMEQELVQRVSTENFEKIKRMLHNITKIKVHIKSYEKERPLKNQKVFGAHRAKHSGKRKKYSLHIQARAPGGPLDVDKAQGFDLARVIHKGFADLKGLIEHRMHLEGLKGIRKK